LIELARPERLLAGFARSSLAALGTVAAARRRPSARFARLVELPTPWFVVGADSNKDDRRKEQAYTAARRLQQQPASKSKKAPKFADLAHSGQVNKLGREETEIIKVVCLGSISSCSDQTSSKLRKAHAEKTPSPPR